MASSTTSQLRSPRVVIIGAGMTGLLLCIKLREAGITDLVCLEKKEKLGGTWRENTYPGVACDVPAHMYTYSFERNPDWSHRYASGDEIKAYFERVGREYGVTESIRFSEAVVSCTYDAPKWIVDTSKGESIVADFVINATGILHHPAFPDIPGLERFSGVMFHTAQWDHDVNLEGKRVGVIGTGSTAAQVIPEIAVPAGRLTIFQRTPQWILHAANKRFSERFRRYLRGNPQRIERLVSCYRFGLEHLLTKAVTGHKFQHWLFSTLCRLNLRLSVRDPQLRKKLTPDYRVGCKRVIVNATFYEAVQRDDVDLVTDGIVEITETGVRTSDGRLHELDVLVLSTGFDPTSYMRPMMVKGKNSLNIDDAWQNKIKTYRSLCMPDFPNNFLMLGPNTPIGNFSVIAMSEVQTAYILKIIARWQRGEFDEIVAKPEAVERFARHIRDGMVDTVWVAGCQSWYLDGDGDPILWPYTWQQWVDEMAEPEMADFECVRFPVDTHHNGVPNKHQEVGFV